MWELDYKESWVLKNWCFWTVVLERLLRVPCTARRSNQSILKKINPEYSLEGLMLKLKLQYFGKELTHWKRHRCWERLKAGGDGDNRESDGWVASPTQWTWVWVDSGSWWWTGKPGVLQSMGSQRFGHDWVVELNWTGPEPTKFLCPWDSPGKDTGVSCHFPSPENLLHLGIQPMSLSLLLWEVFFVCLFV